ncbi:MAG TPA: hypothetical protein VNS32_26995, partial [Flavisolibacter sp.]|nr:hypothetical protein [Flavisolibacter sp.]
MDMILLHPDETKVAFYFINLKGRLFYKIGNKAGTNKVKAWWVKGLFGSVEAIPDLVDSGYIPFKGLLWGKLKVSNAESETVIYLT